MYRIERLRLRNWRQAMFKGILLAGFLALASCAALSPAPVPSPVPVYLHVCPTAPKYTPAFEKAAGVQLQALPAGSPDARMIEDYLTVRSEIGVCEK